MEYILDEEGDGFDVFQNFLFFVFPSSVVGMVRTRVLGRVFGAANGGGLRCGSDFLVGGVGGRAEGGSSQGREQEEGRGLDASESERKEGNAPQEEMSGGRRRHGNMGWERWIARNRHRTLPFSGSRVMNG